MADNHGPQHYAKIFGALVVLFLISFFGPWIGIKAVTLITAFGIAVVKAYLVAAHFMHLNIEKRWVVYMLTSMVAFMFLMFFGIAPDVMNHEGQRWNNYSAKARVESEMARIKAGGGDHHGEGEHKEGEAH